MIDLRVQVQTPAGGWFWVTDTSEGFAFSIYSTNAISWQRIGETKRAHPDLLFRLFDRSPTGWRKGAYATI